MTSTSRAVRALSLSLLFSILGGCIGSRDVEAPAHYLSAVGWQRSHELLQYKSFADYTSAVKDEVRRHRIPFDPDRAELEIENASPVELPLGSQCSDKVNGIAILVHGLSDTAYSMRDLAKVLADACYKSRVILLPGHGTRAGDLLTTRLSDWQETIDYVVAQAAAESNNVIVGGFSLGGVLTLDAALRRPDDIDGVIGISPAYHLSSSRIARWAPLVAPVIRWVDRGVTDDPMRYEAMPMRGVAETWRAMQQMMKNLEKAGQVEIPWLIAQSMDDAVVVPGKNEELWKSYAVHPDSRLIRFVSDQAYPDEEQVLTQDGSSTTSRVLALTHLAVHQSPNNALYGINGRYRNCGANMPRDVKLVKQCEESDAVWYGVWSTTVADDRALAFSTFNPSFSRLAEEIIRFALRIAAQQERAL